MLSPEAPRDSFVKKTFDRIAGRYDFLNRVISLHLDTLWRGELVKALDLRGAERFLLDLGTGTGDLALAAAREVGEKGKVVGLDFSREMLRLAESKRLKVPHGRAASFILGSALAPPFKDRTFDAVMTAFVLRNIGNLDLFFAEAHRLLRPGGKLASLDMFPPGGFAFPLLYGLYFYRLVPLIGACLGRDRVAYRYLSDSVRGFKSPDTVAALIRQAGFEKVRLRKFLRGAVCLHLAEKPLK